MLPYRIFIMAHLFPNTEIERKISNVTNAIVTNAIADMGLSPELETKLRDLRQKKT